MSMITLSRPVTIGGKETQKIELDFDKITGKALIQAEKEVRAMGDTSPSVFLSMQFQAAIAAKIIGVPVDDVLAMPANDFKKLVLPVANFLFTQD